MGCRVARCKDSEIVTNVGTAFWQTFPHTTHSTELHSYTATQLQYFPNSHIHSRSILKTAKRCTKHALQHFATFEGLWCSCVALGLAIRCSRILLASLCHVQRGAGLGQVTMKRQTNPQYLQKQKHSWVQRSPKHEPE